MHTTSDTDGDDIGGGGYRRIAVSPPDQPARVDLVPRLSNAVVDCLREAVQGAHRVALVDFPHHSNVGDNAIWLGERAALRELGVTVAFGCSQGTWDPRALRSAVGDGVVLLHGGGNFGDVWPDHQRFREHVVESLPDKRLILMPQTIHFSSDEARRRTASLLGRHPDLLVLARDQPSVEEAERLGLPVALCPDAAFALGQLPRTRARVNQQWLLRTDSETTGRASQVPSGVVPVDWLQPWSGRAWRRGPISSGRILFSVGQGIDRALKAVPLHRSIAWHAFDRIAREHLQRGVELLSEGEVVITDRLHGHILCLLLGIPHVVLDNRYGKLTRFIDAWTAQSPLVRVATSVEEASSIASSLSR